MAVAFGAVVLEAAFFFGEDFFALGLAFLAVLFLVPAFFVLFFVVFFVAIVSNPQQVGTSAIDIHLPITLKVLSEIYGAGKGEIGMIFEISPDFERWWNNFSVLYTRVLVCQNTIVLMIVDLGNNTCDKREPFVFCCLHPLCGVVTVPAASVRDVRSARDCARVSARSRAKKIFASARFFF
jgi:hypothetical protein